MFMRSRSVLLALFLVFSLTANAGRILPQDAKVGEIRGHAYPEVRIGDTVYRLAPGARIYDAFNRIILPGQLPQAGRVLYQLDPYGNLFRLWLLTPEEEAALGNRAE
jgi:hypothetical protein